VQGISYIVDVQLVHLITKSLPSLKILKVIYFFPRHESLLGWGWKGARLNPTTYISEYRTNFM